MKKGIEAVIKSVEEPQLKRCVEAVKNQTIPFDKIYHVNNVFPEYLAHNKALDQLEYEYVMVINGDTIIDDNAVCKFNTIKKKHDHHKIWGFGFGLKDDFVKQVICCCTVYLSELAKDCFFKDDVTNDAMAGKEMTACGYKFLELFRKGITIGTHFDDPDDFQVFHRFYIRGVKCGDKKNIREYKRTSKFFELHLNKDSRYKTALFAFQKGYEIKHYPTSHDKGFDKELYNRWIK